MRSISLRIEREPLQEALRTLGATRRQRFTSVVPVWLCFDAATGLLRIVEDRGSVTAYVPAEGEWPLAGATVDLYFLRRASAYCRGDHIELHVVEDGLLLIGETWHITMRLLKFGPESAPPKISAAPPSAAPRPLSHLPLFGWAEARSANHRRPEG